MKPKVILSLFPTLLVLFVIGGAQKAGAVEVGVSVGGGYHHGYRDYRTVDPVYDTWYSDGGTAYGYNDNIVTTDTVYVDPYVYATPSVGFDTWYGDGYRGHGGSFSGGGRGYGGGRSSGGGHSSSSGGHAGRR